jgi:hypothetical protein
LTWTYDVAAITTSPLYQVRLELQDTDATEMLLQDEEITWIITQESSTLLAAARGAEIIARLFARQADTVQNPTVKLQFKTRVRAYAELAATLRQRASAARAPISISSSAASKLAASQNTDKTGPYFKRGMHDRFPSNDTGTPQDFAQGNDPLFTNNP